MEEQRSCDQSFHDRFDQFQADNQARMDLMQRSIDLLIQNQTMANGGSNSQGCNSNTPVLSPTPIS